MGANTILTSVVQGGSNSHATVVEEANAVATDFVTQGVVGAITPNTGSGGTGSFCVNADASPDMGVTVKAGKAYILATPSSQNPQVLRARASTDYTTYVINANASGSTKYDWIYLSVNATNANNPDAAADNVTSIFTSRSTSNTSDTGSPPTYGLLLAIVTVANGASSITNSNIADSRFNASVGAQNGSLIVTQSATGQNAVIQAAGIDANVSLALLPKGTGRIILNGAGAPAAASVLTSETTINTTYSDLATTTDTVTVTIGASGLAQVSLLSQIANNTANSFNYVSFVASGANTIAANDVNGIIYQAYANGAATQMGNSILLTGLTAGSTTFKMKYKVATGGSGSGTGTFLNRKISVMPL